MVVKVFNFMLRTLGWPILFLISWAWPDNYERCDKCGKILNKKKEEDFFVEDNGSHVFCGKHYMEYEEERAE